MTLTRRTFGALGGSAAVFASLPAIAQTKTTSHGISAFGDLKYPANFTHFDYANPRAPKGGLWSTGFGNVTFDSFNPYIIKGNPAFYLPARIYDKLMVRAFDEPDAVYGLVASSAELPDDRSWVAFNLRKEARFHDGSPLTSADVVFTLETLKTIAHPTYKVVLAPLLRAVAEGPHRVRYEFDPKAPKRDLPMLAADLPVFSKAFYAKQDFAEASLEPPLGSGPYKIGRFDVGSYVIFDRVKDYWARDLPVNVGKNNFDQIRYDYFRDRTAQFEAFKAGALLFNEEFWSKLWATAYTKENIPALGRGDIKMEVLPDERPGGTQGYWFNLRRKKFEDVRVREAIATVFDFEWSNKRLFYGLYKRTDSFFEGGPMQADRKPSPGELAILEKFADQLPPGVLDQPAYVPPVTNGTGRNRRQLRRAGKLLTAAGWKVVDGKRQKDGEVLRIEFLHGSQGFDRIAKPFTESLKKLGIEATIRTVDPTQYKKRTDDYDYDVVVGRNVMQLTPGVELRDYYSSKSASSKGSLNRSGVNSPVVDALLDVIERAPSREKLTSAVKALDRVLRSMHIWIPQWHKGSHTVAYWDVFARPAVKPRYAPGVEEYWWTDPEKAARLKAAGRL